MMYLAYVFVLAYGTTCCSASIEDRLIELENIVQNQFAENENMKNRVTELEEEVAALIAEGTEQEYGGTSGEIYGDETVVETRDVPEYKDGSLSEHLFTRAAGNNGAFHAYLSQIGCYNDHEKIVFDVEALDVGGQGDVGVYDVRDGIFEPPVAGVYVFTWTVASQVQRKFVAELIIGGKMAGIITADADITNGQTGSGIHPATAVVVAQVPAGTHCYIHVLHTGPECVMVLSDSNQVRTTFSAWRLF